MENKFKTADILESFQKIISKLNAENKACVVNDITIIGEYLKKITSRNFWDDPVRRDKAIINMKNAWKIKPRSTYKLIFRNSGVEYILTNLKMVSDAVGYSENSVRTYLSKNKGVSSFKMGGEIITVIKIPAIKKEL